MNNECRICKNNSEKKFYKVLEKHFGTNEEFEYFECPECSTLQISSIPHNITKYYPENYYSKISIKQSGIKIFLKKKWYQFSFGKWNILGYIFSFLKNKPDFYEWLSQINIDFDNSILDVGSGYGFFLSELELAGFKNLTGIDPYIYETVEYSKNFRVIKGTLEEIFVRRQIFDTILFNHSFEHVPNPLEYLINARKLQDVNKNLIIRIPVSNSYAWEKYGVDWVSLDAPRHFHLLNEKSMEILAKQSSYKIEKIIYDATDFQFWGSELYKNNIPLTKTKLGSKNPMQDFREIVSENDSKEFVKLTKKMNELKKGDQATFFLKSI